MQLVLIGAGILSTRLRKLAHLRDLQPMTTLNYFCHHELTSVISKARSPTVGFGKHDFLYVLKFILFILNVLISLLLMFEMQKHRGHYDLNLVQLLSHPTLLELQIDKCVTKLQVHNSQLPQRG